ncbi:hypothetical protein BH09PAT2_BH09PAT2_05610 [soil metagenome]
MALKIYVKEGKTPVAKAARSISYFILVAGMLLMFWAYYPIISFEIYARLFFKDGTSSPVPENTTATSLQFAQTVYADTNQYSNNLRDFTHANVWFPVSNAIVPTGNIDVKEYSLSIPKLNLKNLQVTVGGEDLAKSLVHYLPSSKPGQYGNIAIFGHSTIPQLFNPKDYKTVFTYLPQMDIGDTVYIDSEGKTYEYEVYDMFIVKPDQVSVLEQKFNAAYLTLITCVPPGTSEKRLIVKAKLSKHTSY